jgi:hypothetical protein
MVVMPFVSRRRLTFASPSRRVRAAFLLFSATVLALCVGACASSPAPSSPGRVLKASPNVITADEISRVNVQDGFEVIQKLRPAMLRPRQIASVNAQAKGELVVYVDNTRYGNAESLRQISASSIAAVRYFSAAEAQTKWGSGHPGGVIEVITKR